jgi:leucine dehydrogenase
MRPYATTGEALDDCLRLARAMTYKAAVAGLDQGGGKSVIIGDPARDKTPEILRAHGRFIETLKGRYIPGIDMGTTQEDLRIIGEETEEAAGVGGDPAAYTAVGVYHAIRSGVEFALGRDGLEGLRIAIQGVGHVGHALARLAAEDGAVLTVADTRQDVAEGVASEVGATVVSPDEILTSACDVLAPCAAGGAITEDLVPWLRCSVVAGATNNVLATPGAGTRLHSEGITYVPDYVANCGGILFLAEEASGSSPERMRERMEDAGRITREVLRRSAEDGVPSSIAAERLAEERLARSTNPRPYVADGHRRYTRREFA